MVDGLTDYDQKGAARRKYLPWGWNGDPPSYDLSTPAATAYGQQRYDAFGRVRETTGLDGTITLRTKYHSLSADAWDAEDIAAGTHYGTYASETKDGHGRIVRTTERVRTKNGGLEERHTEMTYLITGEVTSITRRRGTDTWSRSVEYDTLGHMVQNHEPSSGTWLYAYDKASKTSTRYTKGGTVEQVDSSYGLLVKNVKRSPDGKVDQITYGDRANTTTFFTYDDLRRLRNLLTVRGVPSVDPLHPETPNPWDNNAQIGGVGFSQQLILQDEEFTYDRVGNPTEIRDYRDPAEWPASAKPVNRKMKYDDLYRMSEIDYEYPGGSDQWADVYGSEADSLKASPRADLTSAGRPLKQTYEYDWRGNLVESDDNAHAFYDRSLGTQSHVENTDQLTHAENNQKGGAFTGHLDVQYDLTGNIDTLTINRNGDCKPSKDACKFQQYKYEWDEVGRLMRARRYDSTNTGSDPPAAELTFAYDSGNNRVRKTSGLSHTIYIFDSLELRNTQFDNSTLTYEVSDATEVPYVFAHGVRLGRVVHQSDTVTKLYMELGDHLGSTSVVLEHGTGKLVERNTAYAYGAPESNYRSDVDPDFREDYRFTGKEDDIEVGLIYFGQRYYAPLLQRWLSPDPLAVHAPGQADLNVYAYVHGRVLSAVDAVGLQEAAPAAGMAVNQGLPPPQQAAYDAGLAVGRRYGQCFSDAQDMLELFTHKWGDAGNGEGKSVWDTLSAEQRSDVLGRIEQKLDSVAQAPSYSDTTRDAMLRGFEVGSGSGYQEARLKALSVSVGLEVLKLAAIGGGASADRIGAALNKALTRVARTLPLFGIASDGLGVVQLTKSSVPAAGEIFGIRLPSASGMGFKKFDDFKATFGEYAGAHWHHIVEQREGNIAKFGEEAIHNTNNLMLVDDVTHGQISGYYGSIQPFTGGLLVRNWLAGQSFEQQHQFGLGVLRMFGVTK